jgi:hypothetical protein
MFSYKQFNLAKDQDEMFQRENVDIMSFIDF